jgi:hypothetical protein
VSALSLALHPETSTGATVAIISSGVVAVLALLLFTRIISGGRLKLFAAVFPWLILVVATAGAAATVVGPIRHEFTARTDRLIETNLPNLAQAIQDNARQNGKLPQSLNELRFTSYTQDAQILIDRNLVTYRIIKQPQPVTLPQPATDLPADGNSGASSSATPETSIYPIPPVQRDQQAGRYELCVVYRLPAKMTMAASSLSRQIALSRVRLSTPVPIRLVSNATNKSSTTTNRRRIICSRVSLRKLSTVKSLATKYTRMIRPWYF